MNARLLLVVVTLFAAILGAFGQVSAPVTVSISTSQTASGSISVSNSLSSSASVSVSPSTSITASSSVSVTMSVTASASNSVSTSYSNSLSNSVSTSFSASVSWSLSQTITNTMTGSMTMTPTPSETPTGSGSGSMSISLTNSITGSFTSTGSQSFTMSMSGTGSMSMLPSATMTGTMINVRPVCGNAKIEAGETCEGGPCCNAPGTLGQCTFKRNGQICAKRTGPCYKRPRCNATQQCNLTVRRKQGVPCVAGTLKGFCNGTKCQKTKPALSTTGASKSRSAKAV